MLTRVFAAFAFDTATREDLADLRHLLKTDKISWSPPDRIHLTLRYFQQIDDTALGRLISTLRAWAKTVQPTELHVVGLGVFPNPRVARVVWAGVADPPPLLDGAVTMLEDFAVKANIAADPMKFNPHITLGRVRKDPGEHWWTKFGELEKEDFDFAPLDAVTIYQSTGGEDAVYDRLARIALGTGEDVHDDDEEGPTFSISGVHGDDD
jgi:2'-5' RNA ligase